MMKKTFLLPFLAGLFALNLSFAQNPSLGPCGTTDGKSDWLIAYQSHPQGFPRDADTLYVPITIYIVGTDAGTGYFSLTSLYRAFCTLNKDYEYSAIQFYLEGDINYINNSTYYDHNFQQGGQMMQNYRVDATVNCYIVSNPADNCGYSSYNNGIALAKSCMGQNDHTWAHELGHYLSLPHTFYGWEGYDHDYSQPAPSQIDNDWVERVDGTNCDFAADGFCDTPPDYLNYRWPCDGNDFSTLKQIDPNGEEFYSDGSLFMSYSNDNCTSRFSEEQIQAMRANLWTEKLEYLYNQDAPGPVDMTNFTALTPAQEEFLPTFNNVHFEWEPVPNATIYSLEITTLQSFVVPIFRYYLSEPNFTSFDLDPTRKYYWRVSAFNNYESCPLTSEIFSFETGDVLNSTAETDLIKGISLSPNPVAAGSDVLLNFQATENLDLECTLLSPAGAVIWQKNIPAARGQQQILFQTDGIPAGLYFLQLHTSNGIVSRKLVVGR